MTKNKFSILWCAAYYISLALVAFCQPFMFDSKSSAGLISGLVVALPATYWLLNDSKRRFHVPHVIQPAIVHLWMIVIPLYLLWTRKWWGLIYAVLHVVCSYLVFDIGYRLSVYLVWPVIFPNAITS